MFTNDPLGITLYKSDLYVCDSNNHHVQIFDLSLNFVRSIGSQGNGRGKFNEPHDVVFDTAGNMYVAEWGNRRVQVIHVSGISIKEFSGEKLVRPYC